MASIRIMDVDICVFLLYWTLHSIQAEKHSLFYIYTALSKPVDLPGIYEFSAMGLLDDTQIDYYNSEEKRKIPKQQWMKEKMQDDYWERGTRSRKEKEQWFHLSLKNLMKRRRHYESDLHVLQRRIGCEIEKQGNEFKFSKGVYEFSYDGEDFLSCDIKESQWVAADDTALLTKRKWENEPIINQYTKSYLEKDCVDWLNKYRGYADEELRNISASDVHVFARKCIKEDFKLKLTCMATGVYSKDVMMIIRKNHTSLPEYEMNSTVVQPNHDGSFQIRKTVEIEEDDDDEAEYDCLVSHRSLNESIIVKWDGLCSECPLNTVAAGFVGVVIGGVLVLAISALVFGILVKRKIIVITNPRKPAEEKAGVHLEEGQATESLNATAEEPLLKKEFNKQDTGSETSSSPEKV